jgi:hypothetical protein
MTTMFSDAKANLTPKLRLPEFRNGPGWEETELRTIADPVGERAENGNENDVPSGTSSASWMAA